MRQNAYTFRRPDYNKNLTPVLNKKISLPPAFQEYIPNQIFRNNFSTPPMSGMRGLRSMPGMNITPDVANDAYVSFRFNVPIIADIKEATIARRAVMTSPITVTISMLNNLPSIQLVAIANQLILLPASNARSSFISVVYKLLKDMVATPGPPAGDRASMLDAIDKLESAQPAVLVPPAVILPGGAVGVVVPPGPPGGVPAGPPGGAPAVPPGPPGGAPAVPPAGAPPAGAPVLTPGQEVNKAINDLFVTATFTKNELKDIDDKINSLPDAKEKQQYLDVQNDMIDTITIYEAIKKLAVSSWSDKTVQDMMSIEIKNIQDSGFRNFLNGALDGQMNSLGLGPRPSGAVVVTPGGTPPAGVPGELYYTLPELKQMRDSKGTDAKRYTEYKDFINSIVDTKMYYSSPDDKKGRSQTSPDRNDYVARWVNTNNIRIDGKKYKSDINQRISKLNPASRPDPEGIYSNLRGYIHISMR